MARTYEEVVADFQALEPRDFKTGTDKLYALGEELMALPHPERAIRTLFAVIESMPDTDMGHPGPLVHALEKMRGHYEHQLVESIKRRPTFLTVWMVNRILNATSDVEQRRFYLDLLQFAAEHAAAPESARREARYFIKYQTGAAA